MLNLIFIWLMHVGKRHMQERLSVKLQAAMCASDCTAKFC